MLEGKQSTVHYFVRGASEAVDSLRNRDWPRIILFGTNLRETAYCTHLVLAALLFSPFLLFGHILAANTDLLLEQYPMLLLAKNDFLHGSLGLWNPYAFAGIAQAAEANTPLLFPENWILFLVPSHFLFPTITFVALLKVWLIGIASYKFYCAELLSRRWALFASIACQLCGMTLWHLGSYVGLSVELYGFVLLALLWTLARRSILANYLLCSVATVLLLMAGDIAYGAYALLGIGILVIYRAFSCGEIKHAMRLVALFTSTCVTALLIGSIRLLPTVAMLGTSSTTGSLRNLPDFTNASLLIARFFDTEILGVNIDESVDFFLRISEQFQGYQLHAFGPQFFGIVVGLLALWMLASEKSAKAAFWSIYVVVGLAINMFVQPFDAFARILVAPVVHTQGFQELFLPGLPVLAALAGMSLERGARRDRLPRLTLELFGTALAVIAMFILLILIRNIEPLSVIGSNSARFLVLSLLLGVAIVVWVQRTHPDMLARALALPFLEAVFVAAAIVVLFWIDDNPTFLSHLKNIGLQLMSFSAIAIALILVMRERSAVLRAYGFWICVAIAALSLIVLLYPWTSFLRLTVPHTKGVVLAGLGALRFVLGVIIFFLALRAAMTKRLPARGLYIVFLALLIAEQVPADKIHSHLNANPFYAGTLYPPLNALVDTDGRPVDTASYRINNPNTLLHLPFYNEIFGSKHEICASTNVAYGVRSYGGYTDIIPNRILEFVANWADIRDEGKFCIYADKTDERLLDLLAVGYQYDPKTEALARRPNALSRFMLFTNFEVVSDAKSALARLKEDTFNPLTDIVVETNPGLPSHPSIFNGQRLAYSEINSDHIELQAQTDSPALLLFDDSCDAGWSARVNGQSEQVLVANYNFMAIPLPAGESRIVLEYKPRAFRIGAICAIIGLAVLALTFAIYLVGRLSRNQARAQIS